jgi:hypothetical protein
VGPVNSGMNLIDRKGEDSFRASSRAFHKHTNPIEVRLHAARYVLAFRSSTSRAKSKLERLGTIPELTPFGIGDGS